MKSALKLTRGVAFAALLAVPAALYGQGPASTGTHVGTDVPGNAVDLDWLASSDDGVSFFQAFYLLSRQPWIDVSPSGSVPGGLADGTLDRFTYVFQTTFDGTGLSSIVFNCAVDDNFYSIQLNGNTVSGRCDQYRLVTSNTLTGFVDGANTLTFTTGGNGITDGFDFEVTDRTVTSVSAAPEPNTVVLFGTGIVGLAVAFRRRIRGSAQTSLVD